MSRRVAALALGGGVGEAGRLQVLLDVVADGDRERARRGRRAARTSFGCFQVRSAIRFMARRNRTRFQSECFEKQIALVRMRGCRAGNTRQACSLACRPRQRRRALVAADRARADAGAAALLATSPAPSAAPRPTCSPNACATSRPTASSLAASSAGPVAATVYELTELGRGLERPLIELARWGMELQKAEDVVGLAPSSLPNALRVILRPPADAGFDLGLRSRGPELRPARPRRLDRRLARRRRRARPDPLRLPDRGPGRRRRRPRRRPRGRDRGRGDAARLAAGRWSSCPTRLREEAQMLVECGALLIAAAEAAAAAG